MNKKHKSGDVYKDQHPVVRRNYTTKKMKKGNSSFGTFELLDHYSPVKENSQGRPADSQLFGRSPGNKDYNST